LGNRRFVQQRTTFLSLVVLNVFLSFYGVSEDYTIVKPRQSASSRQTARANAEEMFGKSNAHVIKNAAREDREIRKSVGKEGCAACGRQESSVAQGSQSTAEKFKVCGKCNGIGRTVRYCSRFVVITSTSLRFQPELLFVAGNARQVTGGTAHRLTNLYVPSPPPKSPNLLSFHRRRIHLTYLRRLRGTLARPHSCILSVSSLKAPEWTTSLCTRFHR
jgi:uncharacterized membrane protein